MLSNVNYNTGQRSSGVKIQYGTDGGEIWRTQLQIH